MPPHKRSARRAASRQDGRGTSSSRARHDARVRRAARRRPRGPPGSVAKCHAASSRMARQPFSPLRAAMSWNAASIAWRWVSSSVSHDRPQRVGLGLRQRGNVEIGEDAAGVEIAGQQTVRHLPEEVAGGVVARHRLSARPTRASRRTDRNTRRSAVMSDSQRRVAFPPTAAARRHFLLATPTRGSERDRGEVQRSIWRSRSPDPWLTPPALNPSASCGRARCSFSCTVGRQEQANSNLLRSSTLLRCPSY